MAMNFNPVTGLRDTTQFPSKPTSGAAAREQIQGLLDQVKDYINDTVEKYPACRVYNTTNQSIANSTWTSIAFNSERYDTDSIHDNVTNNTRLTCKTKGKYSIKAHIAFGGVTVGLCGIRILLNGVTPIANHTHPAINGSNNEVSVETDYDLNINDYVEIQAYQTSGSSITIASLANFSPEFMMAKVG